MADTLTESDLRSLKQQITAATIVYREAYAAADQAMSEGNPRAEHLIKVAARALRKRDGLLEQVPHA